MLTAVQLRELQGQEQAPTPQQFGVVLPPPTAARAASGCGTSLARRNHAHDGGAGDCDGHESDLLDEAPSSSPAGRRAGLGAASNAAGFGVGDGAASSAVALTAAPSPFSGQSPLPAPSPPATASSWTRMGFGSLGRTSPIVAPTPAPSAASPGAFFGTSPSPSFLRQLSGSNANGNAGEGLTSPALRTGGGGDACGGAPPPPPPRTPTPRVQAAQLGPWLDALLDYETRALQHATVLQVRRGVWTTSWGCTAVAGTVRGAAA